MHARCVDHSALCDMSVHPDHNKHCLQGVIDTGPFFLSTEQPVCDVQLLTSTLLHLPLIIAQTLSVKVYLIRVLADLLCSLYLTDDTLCL